MTLYDKIIELGNIGFDVKFEQFRYSNHGIEQYRSGTFIALRYNGNGATKIENSKLLTPKQMENEQFVVSEIDRIYREMKPHAIGAQTIPETHLD